MSFVGAFCYSCLQCRGGLPISCSIAHNLICKSKVYAELEAMIHLHHPNVVKFYESCQDSRAPHLLGPVL